MKSAKWHNTHLLAGDEALDAAAALLQEARAQITVPSVGNKTQLAEGFIALACAHYRACEVDARLAVHK